MTKDTIELPNDETVYADNELWTNYQFEQKQQRREQGVKRGAALRKGRRERAKLAEESTTWRPVIKPYRRGQWWAVNRKSVLQPIKVNCKVKQNIPANGRLIVKNGNQCKKITNNSRITLFQWAVEKHGCLGRHLTIPESRRGLIPPCPATILIRRRVLPRIPRMGHYR